MTTRPSPPRRGALLLGIVALAITVRAIYLYQASSDLFFFAPIIDARSNLDDARYLIAQSWLGPPAPFWKPPAYAYLLAIQLRAFGGSLWAPRIVQLFVDTASVWLLFCIGRRLFSIGVATTAMAMMALAGPLVFFTGELVSATWMVFAVLLLLHLLLEARARPSLGRWLGCGVALGFAALLRGEILLLLPVLLIAIARCAGPAAIRPARMVAFLAGVMCAIAPCTARNRIVGHEAVLISTNGGINFYIGTDPKYRGMIGLRPGPEWEELMREPESAGLVGSAAAQSSFHARRAIALIAASPFAYAKQLLRKAALFWHGCELPSNRDLYRAGDHSRLLRLLIWHAGGLFFPFGLVAPLALVGIALTLRRRQPSWLLIGLVATSMVTAMLFFVTSRFRAPALPILILYAAYCLEQLHRQTLRHRLDGRIIVALLVVAVAVSSHAFESDRKWYAAQLAAEEHHYRGTVLFDVHHRYAEAVRELKEALAIDPERASTHFNLGQTYDAMERPDDAMGAYRRVVDLGERARGERYLVPFALAQLERAAFSARTSNATPFARGLRCWAAHDDDCALAAFVADGDGAFIGRVALERGERGLGALADRAAALELGRAASLRPGDARTLLLLGLVRHRLGDEAGAARAFVALEAIEWPRGSLERSVAIKGSDSLVEEACAVRASLRARAALPAKERLNPS